jgi:periplasmic protein TonB
MAYADEGMSRNRMIALAVVAALHVLLAYAFISGLALKAVKVITGPLETVNIKEEAPPPEEPPPPPPKDIDIPPYVPPPEVSIQSDAPPPPVISTQSAAPAPEPKYVAPPAPPQPAAKPGTQAKLHGNRLQLITTDDYPPSSLRREEQGRVEVRFDINEKGRVENCVVTHSVSADLDAATCRLIASRFKYDPATEDGAPVRVTGKTDAVKWQIPTDR